MLVVVGRLYLLLVLMVLFFYPLPVPGVCSDGSDGGENLCSGVPSSFSGSLFSQNFGN